jgi:hypothetical protein
MPHLFSRIVLPKQRTTEASVPKAASGSACKIKTATYLQRN